MFPVCIFHRRDFHSLRLDVMMTHEFIFKAILIFTYFSWFSLFSSVSTPDDAKLLLFCSFTF